MKTMHLKSLQKIIASILVIAIILGMPSFYGFAKNIDSDLALGMSHTLGHSNNTMLDENSAFPLGTSSVRSSNKIILPENTELFLYEEYEGISNYYSYTSWLVDEPTTGTFTSDTVLLFDQPDGYHSINVTGNVTLQRISSLSELFITLEEHSSLILKETTGEIPLQAPMITINANGENTKFIVNGKTNSKNYDILTDTLQINQIDTFSSEPNAIHINDTLRLMYPGTTTFKVGSSLPDGIKDGVYTDNLELHIGAKLVVESNNTPANALHVKNNLILYPGDLTVTGGNKNGILANGDYIQAHHESYITVKTTAPGSTAILHDSTTENGYGNISFSNTNVYAEGDAYGIRTTGGGFNLSGSPHVNMDEYIGESTLKGGISALSITANQDSAVFLNSHKLHLILTGDNPNAKGALHFDPNSSSSQIMVSEGTTVDAVSEKHIFEGAAITIENNFQPTEWASKPLMLDGSGTIKTTMPTYQNSPLWAIKSEGISMNDSTDGAIIQTYTNPVSLYPTSSFPYQVPYDTQLFEWSTEPENINVISTEQGLSSNDSTQNQNIVLTGRTMNTPSTIVTEEPKLYQVVYPNVTVDSSGTVILNPTEGTLQEVNYNITIGKPIGNLPEPKNPKKMFMGWFTEKNGLGTKITPEYIIDTSPITLYAHWTTPIQQITYETNVKGIDPILQQVAMGNLLSPPDVSNDGMSLVGWYLDKDFKTPWDFSKDFVPGNAITLYAKWNANDYTVTFVNGATETVVSFPFGSLIIEPVLSQNENSTFLGWYHGNKSWNFSKDTMPAENITLTAHWKNIAYYTATFDTGSTVSVISVPVGSLIPHPENPVKEGNQFAGWYYNDTSGTQKPWDFEKDLMPKRNITLHAHWKKDNIIPEILPEKETTHSSDSGNGQKDRIDNNLVITHDKNNSEKTSESVGNSDATIVNSTSSHKEYLSSSTTTNPSTGGIMEKGVLLPDTHSSDTKYIVHQSITVRWFIVTLVIVSTIIVLFVFWKKKRKSLD